MLGIKLLPNIKYMENNTHFCIKLDEITGARNIRKTFENGTTFDDTWLAGVCFRCTDKEP